MDDEIIIEKDIPPILFVVVIIGFNLVVIGVALVVPLVIAIMLFLVILTMDVVAFITYKYGGEK